jgi:hypothetical protein
MELSNRGYAQTVSKNLAEVGLERALAAFNSNSFAGWTLPNATTATLSFTLPSARYGSPSRISTATVNLRVEHYRDIRKATIWTPLVTPPGYSSGDFVWYQGVWYQRLAGSPGMQTPADTSVWKAAPHNWDPHANYKIGNIALAGGSAYRCIADNVSQTPPNATYWTAVGAAPWDPAISYNVDDIVFSGGLPYRCLTANSNQAPPNATYWLSEPVIYSEGVAVLPDVGGTTLKTQIRATLAPAALFPNAAGAGTDIIMNSAGYVDSYNQVLGAYTVAPATTNRGASAIVAGDDTTVSNAVAIGNMRIYGFVAATSNSTSPYAPRFTIGTSGFITGNLSATAASPPNPRIDNTRVSRSPYVPRFDIQNVSGAGVLPNGTTVLDEGATTLGTPGATTPTVYSITGTQDAGYTYSGVYLYDAGDVLTINGPVILKVSGQLYTYLGKILITSTGSLEVYYTGTLYIGSSTAGTGIENQTLDPKKCILVGTSTDNYYGAHYFWTITPFYGTIYMPNAYVALWTNVKFYGAISASNVRFPNTGVEFHYDTSLRTAGRIGTYIDSPYRIAEWRELIDASERVSLP